MKSKVDEFLQAEAQGIRDARAAVESRTGIAACNISAGDFATMNVNNLGTTVITPTAGWNDHTAVNSGSGFITTSTGSGHIGSTVSIAATAISQIVDRNGNTAVYGQINGQSPQNQPKPQTLRTLIDEKIFINELRIGVLQHDIDVLKAKKQKMEAALDIEMRDIDELRGY